MLQLQKFISTLNLSIKSKNFYFKITYTKFILNIIQLLVKRGYFIGFKLCSDNPRKVVVFFKMNLEQKSLIFSSCHQVSKPNRPIFFRGGQMPINTTSLFVLSTERGLLTHKEASIYKIGGLVLFKLI